MRQDLKRIAMQTMDLFAQGIYPYKNKMINIEEVHQQALKHARFFPASQSIAGNNQITAKKAGIIEVENIDIVQAITSKKICYGVLNFASAYHPGGGFLNGALAQEEALCFGSDLYLTQLKFQEEFYEFHKSIKTKCYSDAMIYSPKVVYIRDERYAFLPEPGFADVLTSPAVNLGVALQRGEDEERCYQIMEQRMRKILRVLEQMGNTHIILGAFGCGVFRNDPVRIADIWKKLLIDEQWKHHFDEILFAVYDHSSTRKTIQAFERLKEIE